MIIVTRNALLMWNMDWAKATHTADIASEQPLSIRRSLIRPTTARWVSM